MGTNGGHDGLVSGPLRTDDVIDATEPPATEPEIEITPSREAQIGAAVVRRSLPTRARRTVGAWCFLDHAPAARVDGGGGMQVGPHPHTGLQTVTWLLAGEVVHTDSLGSEQLIRPGQLNLMTAGHGVVHAEKMPSSYRGDVHAVQLWVAQPERTRDGEAAFAHHSELPKVEIGSATATVLIGSLGEVTSPARRDTDHFGVDLELRTGPTVLPLNPGHEHAVVVLDGELSIGERALAPDQLVYLGSRRDELEFVAHTPARALLLGGTPFEARPLMWWNFVARTQAEIDEAYEAWQAGSDRFGPVASTLPLVPAPPPLWRTKGQPFVAR